MLGDVAERMLEMMGFGKDVPGAIDAEDVPRALENLRNALARLPDQVEPAGDADNDQPAVSLRTRALPFIEMLEAVVSEQTYLRWE